MTLSVPLLDASALPDDPAQWTSPLAMRCARLHGARVVVVGLGISGMAMARWLDRQGAVVTVLDDRDAPPNQAALQRDCPRVRLVQGVFDAASLDGAQLVCWSPGLSHHHGPASSLHHAAIAAGMPVVGELELFGSALEALALLTAQHDVQADADPHLGADARADDAGAAEDIADPADGGTEPDVDEGPDRAALNGEDQPEHDPSAVTDEVGEPLVEANASMALDDEAGDEAGEVDASSAANVPVVSEVSRRAAAAAAAQLARSRPPAGYRPRIVAVTGTNGKTTVVEMMVQFAREAGLDAQAAGNIGPSLLDALTERLDAQRLPDFWALELSSFQLALGRGIACTASVILNVTQDHGDWHPTPDDYRDCKLRIHAQSRCWIVNRDDPLTDPLQRSDVPGTEVPTVAAVVTQPSGQTSGRSNGSPDGPARARAARGGRPPKVAKPATAHPRMTFGLSIPDAADAFGLVLEGGLEWLTQAVPDPEDTRRGAARRDPAQRAFHLRRLMPADALQVRGNHNRANALAALALGAASGLPMAAMLRALRDFHAAAHRCAPVAVINEIEYIDDSKGTNVGATVAALEGLGKTCVLIAGGLGKGQDFAPLAVAVRRHARAVVLIGRDAAAMRLALMHSEVALFDAANLPEAVRQASTLARPGDAVLLSPACASMDMFRNYAHRAEIFVDAVRELAHEAGLA